MRFAAVCLIMFGLLGAVSAAADFVTGETAAAEFELRNNWAYFKTKFGKSYESTEVENYRMGVFARNMAKIEELNAGSSSPVFGLTKFADLEPSEFKRQYLGYRPHFGAKAVQRTKAPLTKPKFSVDAAVTSVDWRQKGAVTPVKDQGQCGSCWAFSATEEVESMWYLKHGVLPVLSPQQVVSCDTKTGDQGCNGGDTVSAYTYIKGAGLETEKAYPYTSGLSGANGKCTYSNSSVAARITGFTYATPGCFDSCDSQSESTLLNNLASTGPVSICVYAESWQFYSGGVLSDDSNCPHAYTNLDHCVQLVGYQASSSANYWIIRNSWGSSWGENGYIYVKYGSNLCGVADEATFATAA